MAIRRRDLASQQAMSSADKLALILQQEPLQVALFKDCSTPRSYNKHIWPQMIANIAILVPKSEAMSHIVQVLWQTLSQKWGAEIEVNINYVHKAHYQALKPWLHHTPAELLIMGAPRSKENPPVSQMRVPALKTLCKGLDVPLIPDTKPELRQRLTAALSAMPQNIHLAVFKCYSAWCYDYCEVTTKKKAEMKERAQAKHRKRLADK